MTFFSSFTKEVNATGVIIAVVLFLRITNNQYFDTIFLINIKNKCISSIFFTF